VGTSAAPLRKELMDSGLGEALVGGGLQGDLRQPVFSIGLKGAAPENFQQVGRHHDQRLGAELGSTWHIR
jgi:presequence protease